MSDITIKNIPTRKIYLDGVEQNIYVRNDEFPTGERRDHGREGPGYQRDPWHRIKWIEQRVPHFSDELARPLDVSERTDGHYAAMDGGGRWLLAQLAGVDTLSCRIHKGLTRKEEAALFSAFDGNVYKLRSIDKFLAALAAGNEWAAAIAEAAKPYRIAVRGIGTIKAVGALSDMYVAYEPNYAKGARLIQKTCAAAATAWSGYVEGGTMHGRVVEGKYLNAIGLVVDVAERLDLGALHRALTKNPMIDLDKSVEATLGKRVPTNAATLHAAKLIAKSYNRSFAGEGARKIALADLDACPLFDSIERPDTFASLLRQSEETEEAAE